MASTDSAERIDQHGPAASSAPAGRQPLALRIVHEEHERLAAVVHGMRHLARAMEEQGLRPDLKVLRAMLLYISEYPERLHHPKEDRFLFAPLRNHTHLHDAMLVELEVQHAQGEAMVRRLAHALARHEFGGPVELAYFVQQVKRYADFYTRHMRLEEEVIFPALREHLTEQEWQEAGEAFAGNRDPLAGLELKQDFERLYTSIVNITPAPWGLGPAL
ncbi:hemerythrin domain-containing protein [Noviherbaspirillum soli]|uniref:hemerythrin domain-containing protein n=1 Tax=Noviherbaspirillum soli TaxID=1064518 RepID=UPI00188BE676|nr:hemerythrin domain-containing protein [Noviherbaspirillum soli]